MTVAQSVHRPAAIAGFPLSAWAFALRMWAAMMVALYAAFWLQLESASSAAVTVGVLALQTRGQVFQKAVYRVLATIVGVVASFVIAGLFPQSPGLFLIGFAGWLGLCVYVGGLLDGNRAYSAVLSGYTVALVAVTQIDSPQNIFSAAVNVIAPAVDREDPEDLAGRIRQTKAVWFPGEDARGCLTRIR
jgi:uncharacterized membrane protein YccC